MPRAVNRAQSSSPRVRHGVLPVDALLLRPRKKTLNYPFEKGPLSPRFRGEPLSQWRGPLHRLQAVRGDLPRASDHYRSQELRVTRSAAYVDGQIAAHASACAIAAIWLPLRPRGRLLRGPAKMLSRTGVPAAPRRFWCRELRWQSRRSQQKPTGQSGRIRSSSWQSL
jgi:hypothetical protein